MNTCDWRTLFYCLKTVHLTPQYFITQKACCRNQLFLVPIVYDQLGEVLKEYNGEKIYLFLDSNVSIITPMLKMALKLERIEIVNYEQRIKRRKKTLTTYY